MKRQGTKVFEHMECPLCTSHRVVRNSTSKTGPGLKVANFVSYGCLEAGCLLGIPAMLLEIPSMIRDRRNFKCQACGHRWTIAKRVKRGS